MEPSARENVTPLLLNWRKGDKSALDRLIPLAHGELAFAKGWLYRELTPGSTDER